MDKTKARKGLTINLAAVALLLLLLLAVQGAASRYISGILMTICINVILVTSLNLTTGFLGQIALGHAGFMAVGAYAAAIFSKAMQSFAAAQNNVTLLANGGPTAAGTAVFLCSLLLGGLVAAVFGVLVGIPALRLRGDYLAIITLGFGEIIRVIIENLTITGGAQGLSAIPRLAALPLVYGITVLCVGAVCLCALPARTRHHRHPRGLHCFRGLRH